MNGHQKYHPKAFFAVVGAALVVSALSGSLIAEFAVGRADVQTYERAPQQFRPRHRLWTGPGDTIVSYDATPRTAWAAPLLSTPVERQYVDDNRLEDDLAKLEAQWKAEDRAREKEDRAKEAELRTSLEAVTTQPSTWLENQTGGSAPLANTTLVEPVAEPNANNTPT